MVEKNKLSNIIKSRYFILLMVISIILSASIVVVSVVSKESLIDVDLDLDYFGGHGYQRYNSESFSNQYSEYLLIFTSIDSTLEVTINDSEGILHIHRLFPSRKRIKFVGEIDYIGLNPFVRSCSFHFKLQGVKFDTTYAYFPLGVVYSVLFIFFVIKINCQFL